jgi:hypothetical protein
MVLVLPRQCRFDYRLGCHLVKHALVVPKRLLKELLSVLSEAKLHIRVVNIVRFDCQAFPFGGKTDAATPVDPGLIDSMAL